MRNHFFPCVDLGETKSKSELITMRNFEEKN